MGGSTRSNLVPASRKKVSRQGYAWYEDGDGKDRCGLLDSGDAQSQGAVHNIGLRWERPSSGVPTHHKNPYFEATVKKIRSASLRSGGSITFTAGPSFAGLKLIHFNPNPLEVQVYNITQSEVNPLTWGKALDLGAQTCVDINIDFFPGRYHVKEFPFSVCLWYPGGSIKSSWIFHQMAHLFTHLLPAYFIDLLLILLGKKPFMVKIQKRISNGLELLQYYTTKEWYFKNDNFLALQKFVSPEENKIFYTDLNEVDWSLYIRNYIKGAREYCCKEDPSTLPQARRLHNQLYYIDKAFQFFFYFIISWLVYSYVHFFYRIFNAAGSAVSVLLPIARVVATEHPE
ncbi:Putative fatty acyl-CoA reductase CG5065 [Eumeta japonica]|uniref:Fatty acyl-CoA reductase CG5065 n=1 Tax=Eumeta variegata TaxID=151549 RepID=A0A4C1WEQ2_EUMVA|nr:Putative fatty acyl-CoA reductase CG5065 [Eumeta japonica]